MLKLVKINNIKYNENTVVNADAEFICDVIDEFDENEILDIRDDIDYKNDDSIFVLWRIEDDLATCEYVLFDNFIDCAEWDFRVISAVAADNIGIEFEI